MIEISIRHLSMSSDYLRDARSGQQSHQGSVDCAFEAGYFALLSVLTETERRAVEHPSPVAIALGAYRLGIDMEPGLLLLQKRLSFSERPSLAESLGWAEAMRAKVHDFNRD
jgi:hypothetical protein